MNAGVAGVGSLPAMHSDRGLDLVSRQSSTMFLRHQAFPANPQPQLPDVRQE